MTTTQHTMMTVQKMAAMKRAELLSTLGAGVLGFGIALLLPNLLAGYAAPVIALGFAAHGVGMVQMRSIEQEADRPRAKWMEALYWFYWLALASLLVYVVIRAIGWA